MKTPNSYKAIVHANRGFLLGGCRVVESTPFVSAEDAQTWGEVTVETNKGCFNDVCEKFEIQNVFCKNPILPLELE